MSDIIEKFEKAQMKKECPNCSVGDTVIVHKQIVEGKKTRIQKFEGIVIKKVHGRHRKSITVRKIVGGIGVEKTFLLHSPLVPTIEIKRHGKVRRARLFYLRDRIGKRATKVKEASESTK